MNTTITQKDAICELVDKMLIVVDKKNLHLMGRFFQAMLINFLKVPGKVRVIRRLNLSVAFIPPRQPDYALTITFARGRVILESGMGLDPDIKLIGDASVLLNIARLPAGKEIFAYLKSHPGKDLITRMRRGDLKIRGIFKRPLGFWRFTNFMAPNVK